VMRLAATEAETLRAIMDYLAVERIFAFRINTAAMRTEGRFFRAHSLGAGCPDILALPEDQSCDDFGNTRNSCLPTWIEVKALGRKQSPEQISFQVDVERRGHKYVLAYSLDDVIRALGAFR